MRMNSSCAVSNKIKSNQIESIEYDERVGGYVPVLEPAEEPKSVPQPEPAETT